SGAGTLQTLQSPDAVIRARRYVVFLEMSSAAAELIIVDPVEHRSTRLELPEVGASILGLALASDRVVAIPVPTPAALLAGRLPVYGIDAATGSLLWHQDFDTRGGLSFGGFAAGIFWTYNPGTHLLEGFDETTLHKKWERANIAIDTEFPSVRMPQASGEPPLVI